jgi:WD40 repeat protein
VKSQVEKPEPPRCAAVFSPDGRFIFTAGADRNVRIWRSTSGALVRRVGGVSGPLAISPNGRLLAALGTGGVLTIRDAVTLRPERTLSHGAPFTAAAFSPNGRLVVTAGDDHVARIWDVQTGALVRVLRGHDDATHENALTDVEFSHDGRLVVTASRNHLARVWNAATGTEVELKGHFGPVFGASFSPNDRWVVTAGPTTAGVWEVASSRLLLYLHGHTGPLTSASFFPGGTRILTSSRDGTVRTYTCLACGGVDALLAAAKARLEILINR